MKKSDLDMPSIDIKPTPERAKLGCLNLITCAGCFSAGVYRGLNVSQPDLQINTVLLGGLPLIAGYLGNKMAGDLLQDRSALSQVENQLEEKIDRKYSGVSSETRDIMKQQVKVGNAGCMPLAWGMFGLVTGAALEGVGYFVGSLFR